MGQIKIKYLRIKSNNLKENLIENRKPGKMVGMCLSKIKQSDQDSE